MIAALEATLAVAANRQDLTFPHTPPRLLLLSGGMAMLLGIALLSVVIWRSMSEEVYSLTGHPEFWLSLALITVAGVLLVEGWRGRRAMERV